MSMQSRCCPPAELPEMDYSGSAELLKALADEHRLRILAMLAAVRGEVCVCDFTARLPLNQPTVSHHLRILREAGLLESERRGTWVYYRLRADARERVEGALAVLAPQKAPA